MPRFLGRAKRSKVSLLLDRLCCQLVDGHITIVEVPGGLDVALEIHKMARVCITLQLTFLILCGTFAHSMVYTTIHIFLRRLLLHWRLLNCLQVSDL